MFKRDNKEQRKGQKDTLADETVLSGMISVMNSLCNALTPVQQSKQEKRIPGATLSPMKKAELCSTYLKQLSELQLLHESAVLSEEEYEEQRRDVVDLMRQLKENM